MLVQFAGELGQIPAIGRPLGGAALLEQVDAALDRPIAPGKRKAEAGGWRSELNAQSP